MWGRLATCAAVDYRRCPVPTRQLADCQSAAAYQAAPQSRCPSACPLGFSWDFAGRRPIPTDDKRRSSVPLEHHYNVNKMRLSQNPIVILAASLILPPAGLILLWLRKGASVLRKSLGSLAIVIVGFAQLFLLYGMHMEFTGGIRPVFSFQGGERHYRQ